MPGLIARKKPRTLSVILGGGRGARLYPLTKLRAKPAVPLGGKYRLIDVPISNCLNSGLNQMYVLTQFQSTSLHRHVKASYHFDRFGGGFIEVLAAQQTHEGDHWYQGTADAVRQNLRHFGDGWDEILILSGDQLYRMDYELFLANHRATQADISLCVLPASAADAPSLGIVNVQKSGRIAGFREKPPSGELRGLETDPELFKHFGVTVGERPYLASMGIYIFSAGILQEQLLKHDYIDFGRHLFPACLDRYNVQAYVFDGYWEDIGTVKSFHEANLSLAKPNSPFNFSAEEGLIYTRPRMLPGSNLGRCEIRDSIIADGCRIGEAVLEESVLGVRSVIGHGVRLVRTLVMGADQYEHESARAENRAMGRPDVGLGDNVHIENAIVDKNARIGSDVVIRNPDSVTPSESETYAVRDGVICLFKGAVIPSGTRIGT